MRPSGANLWAKYFQILTVSGHENSSPINGKFGTKGGRGNVPIFTFIYFTFISGTSRPSEVKNDWFNCWVNEIAAGRHAATRAGLAGR